MCGRLAMAHKAKVQNSTIGKAFISGLSSVLTEIIQYQADAFRRWNYHDLFSSDIALSTAGVSCAAAPSNPLGQ